jgi:hypothetical protein
MQNYNGKAGDAIVIHPTDDVEAIKGGSCDLREAEKSPELPTSSYHLWFNLFGQNSSESANRKA